MTTKGKIIQVIGPVVDVEFNVANGPLPKIYDALERMSGRRGADIFYIDDRSENVEAAAARGWRMVLHESPEKTRDALHKFISMRV